MNFQQLRSVREAARRNFNLTDVANALFTSQPGVSAPDPRAGGRAGRRHLRAQRQAPDRPDRARARASCKIIERLLRRGREPAAGQQRIRGAGQRHADRRRHPHAGALCAAAGGAGASARRSRTCASPCSRAHRTSIAEWVLSGLRRHRHRDRGPGAPFRTWCLFPCYRWSHLVVVPDGHPLLSRSPPIRLADLAEYPLITYDVGFTGRGHIDAAFAAAGVNPDIMLTAMDSDVIKQYVVAGDGGGYRRLDGLRSRARPRVCARSNPHTCLRPT